MSLVFAADSSFVSEPVPVNLLFMRCPPFALTISPSLASAAAELAAAMQSTANVASKITLMRTIGITRSLVVDIGCWVRFVSRKLGGMGVAGTERRDKRL